MPEAVVCTMHGAQLPKQKGNYLIAQQRERASLPNQAANNSSNKLWQGAVHCLPHGFMVSCYVSWEDLYLNSAIRFTTSSVPFGGLDAIATCSLA